MFTIGMTHQIPLDTCRNQLEGFRIIAPETGKFDRNEIISAISECDAFFFMLDVKCDEELLAHAPRLKVVGNLGSGFDNVDVDACTKRGIMVLNTPCSVIAPTSEMTMALILAITRNVVGYDRTFRADRTCHKELLCERDMCLEGKRLGVLGFGRIGKAVAKKALAFGMQISYYDVYRATPEVETEYHATYRASAEEVLREADVVTIHMAYTPSNWHFINKERLAIMKATAYLVNASRGPIVCEEDLYKCLKHHGIRGAAMDVHESEPHVSEKIASLENVVITPHISTNIAEIRLNMLQELTTGVHSVLVDHEVPRNLVNRDVVKRG